MSKAEGRLQERAKIVVDEQELVSWSLEASDKQVQFWRRLDKTRQELLQMLVSADGRAFVDYMTEQLESLVPFTEVLDAVYQDFRQDKK
jgi:hypothetical protein